MIDPKDLRIGNWVKNIYTNKFHQITLEDFKAEAGFKNFEAISIDQNLFEVVHTNNNGSFEILTSKRIWLFTPYNDSCTSITEGTCKVGIACGVHTVQNIIYFITGEEIKIYIDSMLIE